jgi:hypothetical protein
MKKISGSEGGKRLVTGENYTIIPFQNIVRVLN